MAAISIIIANYNNGHFFTEAYQSLLAQTSLEWEAVVIDDASTDDSVQHLQKLIGGDPRFRFYRNDTNLGYQRTLILGIELAGGEIFGRLDPDDALAPEAVELSLQAHREHPEAGMVYSDLTVCDEHLTPKTVHRSMQISHLNDHSLLFHGEISPFATIKKSFYARTSGIDPALKRSEDVDLYMKMSEVAPVVHLPRLLYFYRIHHNSASKMANEERSYFWHWAALVKAAERRNTSLEDVFMAQVVCRTQLSVYKERVKYIKSLLVSNRLISAIASAMGFKDLKR